jgi:hypothetical protein
MTADKFEQKPVEELPKTVVKNTTCKKKDSDELLMDMSAEALRVELTVEDISQALEDSMLDAVVTNALDAPGKEELSIFQADGLDLEAKATDSVLLGMDSLMESELETSFKRIAKDFDEDDGRDYEGMNPE